MRQRLVAAAIMGSNTIEGYSVELSTAAAIVSGAPVPASVPDESRDAVLGYRDALTWVMRTSEMEFFNHSEVALSALHFMMTRHAKDKSPGRYRRSEIVVTGSDPMAPAYVGPPAEQVPALMGRLIDWLEGDDSTTHLLVRAAMAHLNLVLIHPWRDENGRMSRCLQACLGEIVRPSNSFGSLRGRVRPTARERSSTGLGLGYGATLYYIAAGEAGDRTAKIASALTAPAIEPYER